MDSDASEGATIEGMSEKNAELERAVAEFTGAFALVFDQDWDYSQWLLQNLGMRIIGPTGSTFLNPEIDPQSVNWGARAAFLRAHTRLLAVMEARGIEPKLPIPDPWFVYHWPESETPE